MICININYAKHWRGKKDNIFLFDTHIISSFPLYPDIPQVFLASRYKNLASFKRGDYYQYLLPLILATEITESSTR